MKTFQFWSVLALVLSSPLLWGHARLADTSDITPRNTNSGIKTGPCGGVPRTGTPKTFVKGSQVIIRWIETINHVGNYFIEFSPNGDANWVRLATIADAQNGGNLPHPYSQTVNLPNVECTACTVRLVQEMLDNPNSPTYYYSCGDVVQTAQGAAPPPAPPVGPPAPPVPPVSPGVQPPSVPASYPEEDSQESCH